MKTGKLIGWITKGAVGGALVTAAAAQIAAWSGAVTLTTVANLSWVAAASAKIAAIGSTVLGPFAAAAAAVFGTGGALSGFLGSTFGIGALSTFVAPLMVALLAVTTLVVLSTAITRGGEMIDHMQEASQERKQAAEKAKSQSPEAGIVQERGPPASPSPQKQTASPSPTPASEEAWHPADDDLRRGVSYRDKVLSKARAQQSHAYAPG